MLRKIGLIHTYIHRYMSKDALVGSGENYLTRQKPSSFAKNLQSVDFTEFAHIISAENAHTPHYCDEVVLYNQVLLHPDRQNYTLNQIPCQL